MPGHEDREDDGATRGQEDGPSGRNDARSRRPGRPWPRKIPETSPPAAMMPGHEDREDMGQAGPPRPLRRAAMMPGHEDREDWATVACEVAAVKCRNDARSRRPGRHHRDVGSVRRGIAAMMPGHEDREDTTPSGSSNAGSAGRNDARSRRPGRLGDPEILHSRPFGPQ